jgi:hypothetical protein
MWQGSLFPPFSTLFKVLCFISNIGAVPVGPEAGLSSFGALTGHVFCGLLRWAFGVHLDFQLFVIMGIIRFVRVAAVF